MTDNIPTLSFSTINNCLQPENSHNWLNKQMGAEVPFQHYFEEGKICHRIIQDHVAGIKEDDRLSHIPLQFDVVEIDDKDTRTEFTFNINEKYEELTGKPCPLSKQYNFHGFFDGRDIDWTKMLEIKSSSTLWSVGKFLKAMQRKCYSIVDTVVEAYLITCPRDPKLWSRVKPKYFKVPITHADRVEGIEWIVAGAMVLDKGEFHGGLEDGVCTMARCPYGRNCNFR